MRIAFGCDHAGFKLKEPLAKFLKRKGHQVIDFGCWGTEPRVDYPDYAKTVAFAVRDKKANLGILCCGTGIGMSIVANKVKGIRAAVVWDAKTASLAKEHNQANVLCLGGRLVRARIALQALKAFFKSLPSREPRHKKRIQKIHQMEN